MYFHNISSSNNPITSQAQLDVENSRQTEVSTAAASKSPVSSSLFKKPLQPVVSRAPANKKSPVASSVLKKQQPPKPPAKPSTSSIKDTFSNGSRVLAKVSGFPYWPAEIIEPDGNITYLVQFPEGNLGKNAVVKTLSSEAAQMELTTNKAKYKKTSSSKKNYIKRLEEWGVMIPL